MTPLVRKLAAQHGVDLASVSGYGRGRTHPQGGRARRRDSPLRPAASARPRPPRRSWRPHELRGTTAADVAPAQGVSRSAPSSRIDLNGAADDDRRGRCDRSSPHSASRSRTSSSRRPATSSRSCPFFCSRGCRGAQGVPDHQLDARRREHRVPRAGEPLHRGGHAQGPLHAGAARRRSKSLAEIASGIADLAARTRDGKLKPDDLAGGTFTITNTGSRGALFDTPLVFLPQSAILGTGIVYKRPGVTKVD